MSTKPYYGYKDLPKGTTRATKKEAVKAKQVRYYGVSPITNKEIEKYSKPDRTEANEIKRAKLYIDMKQKLQLHKYETDPAKKKRLKKSLDKMLVKFNDL
jgi:hypothetical protein